MSADRAGDDTAATVAAVLAAHTVEGVGPGGECWCRCGMGDEGRGTLWNAEKHRAHVAAAVVAALAEAGTERPEGTTVTARAASTQPADWKRLDEGPAASAQMIDWYAPRTRDVLCASTPPAEDAARAATTPTQPHDNGDGGAM